ncbi:unnamed protein product [Rhodiola kirilowii]
MSTIFLDEAALYDFVVTQGHGIKGLSDLGLTEVPQKCVKPPHQRIEHPNPTPSQYENKPIDLSRLNGSNYDQQVADQIVHAAENLGFFQVINHGVSVELLEAIKIVAHKFFQQKPERKVAYARGVSTSPFVKYVTSYNPEKETSWDWRDCLSLVHTSDAEALEYWPAECKEIALEYLNKSFKMIRTLLEVLLGKLGVILDDEKFEDYTGIRLVNLNYYPPCPNPELTNGACPHSDMGILTVLLQDGVGGLSVKAGKDIGSLKKGDWIDIPPMDGALVINVGDVLQILSNGRYVSAEHRVRTTDHARVSVPIFTSPRPSVKIGPLSQTINGDGKVYYKEVLLEEYMDNFINTVHVGKESLDFVEIKNHP